MFEKLNVKISVLTLMEDYDMGITERIVNKKGEDYLKLKQSIVTYPNPEGKKPLEINVLCSKAFKRE